MKNSLTYLKGNIFSSSAEVIVNPVNTFGVMGKGLAAEFKRRYPDMFRKYKAFCEQKNFLLVSFISLAKSITPCCSSRQKNIGASLRE